MHLSGYRSPSCVYMCLHWRLIRKTQVHHVEQALQTAVYDGQPPYARAIDEVLSKRIIEIA